MPSHVFRLFTHHSGERDAPKAQPGPLCPTRGILQARETMRALRLLPAAGGFDECCARSLLGNSLVTHRGCPMKTLNRWLRHCRKLIAGQTTRIRSRSARYYLPALLQLEDRIVPTDIPPNIVLTPDCDNEPSS